jgi:hypothetical protein
LILNTVLYYGNLKGLLFFADFFRTITETVGNTNRGTGVWSRMASLVDCKSEEDYDQLCDLLIGKCFLTAWELVSRWLLTTLEHENTKVQGWASHKKQPIIKAGLNKSCSNIPAFIYDSIRNHTNAAEQSHHKANAAGKRLTLSEAVRK